MNKEEYIIKLKELDLPKEEFVILSGGSLLMRGLRKETADMDLSVSEKLAEQLDLFNCPKDKDGMYVPFENVQMNIDMYRFSFDVIDGFQCESLNDILRQKKEWNRPKDQADIQVIEAIMRSLIS